MLWRVEIQADNIVDLLDEVWVVTQFERTDPVGLKTVRCPHPMYEHMIHTHLSGHRPR